MAKAAHPANHPDKGPREYRHRLPRWNAHNPPPPNTPHTHHNFCFQTQPEPAMAQAQVGAIFSAISGQVVPVVNGTHTNANFRFSNMYTNLNIRSTHLIPDPKDRILPVLCAKNYTPLNTDQRAGLVPQAGTDPVHMSAKRALTMATEAKTATDVVYGALVFDVKTTNFRPSGLKSHRYYLDGPTQILNFNIPPLPHYGVTSNTHATIELIPATIDFPPNQLHTPWKELNEMQVSTNTDINEQTQQRLLFRWRLKPIGISQATPLKLSLVLECLAIPGSLPTLQALAKNVNKLVDGPAAPVFELWVDPKSIQWQSPLDPPLPHKCGIIIMPWIAMAEVGHEPEEYTPLSDDMLRR